MVNKATMKFILLLLAGFSAVAYGATKTFDGGAGGSGTNWSVAANWDNDVLPSEGDDIVIPTGFSTVVDNSFSAGAFIASLSVNGTGSVTLQKDLVLGGALAVAGTLTLNTNTLSIYDSDISITGTLSGGSGKIYVESGSDRSFAISNNSSLGELEYNATGIISRTLTIGSTGSPTLTINDELILVGKSLISLSNVTLSYSTASLVYNGADKTVGDEWSNPQTIDIRQNTITLNSTKSFNGTLKLNGGNFSIGSSGNLTITGTVELLSGSFSNSGTFAYSGSSSTLVYRASQAIGAEWPSTNGPTDVVVNISSGSVTASASKLVLGSLNLTAGTINLGSNDLTVLGNVLSDISGNGTIADATTLVMGDRTTPANSTVDQTITGSLTLNKLYINKTGQAGGIVDNRVTVSGILSFTGSGNITINNGDLKLTTDGRFSSSNLGTLTLVVNSGGLLQTGGQSLTTIGTISAASGRIEFDGSSTETLPTGITVGTVEIDNSSVAGVNVNSGTLTVSTSLILSNGVVATSATNVLRLGASATISGTPSSSNMVVGPLQLTINDAADHVFPIGTTGKYRPATFSYDSFNGSNEILEMQYFESNPGGTAPSGISIISNAAHYTLRKISGTSPSPVSYDLTLTYTDISFTPEDRTRVLVQNGSGPVYSLPASQSHNTGSDLVTAENITALPTNNFRLAFGSGTATLYWVSGNGNWSAGSNWSSGFAPENGDVVVINNDGINNLNTSAFTVTFDNSVGTINPASLTIGDGAGTNRVVLDLASASSTLNLSGTILTVNNDADLVFGNAGVTSYTKSNTTYSSGSIAEFRGHDVESDSYSTLKVNNSSSLDADGIINVFGDFEKNGAGSLAITGTLNFSGTTFTMNGAGLIDNSQGTVVFNGSSAQNIANGSGSLTLHDLTINNINHVTLNDPVTINGQLTMTNGNLLTTTVNIPTLLTGATATSGSQSSYIDGPVNLQTNSTTEKALPVGNNGKWRRIAIKPVSATATTYRAAFHNESPFATFASGATPSGLSKVSTLYYWTIAKTSGTANADIKLFWESVNDGIDGSMSDLRVASINSGLTTWSDIGGTGTGAAASGFVSYGAATSFTGFTIGSSNGENSLPVELTSFAAENAVGGVTLSWTVESELNNEAFVLQRKADIDSDFITVKEILGRGTDPIAMDYSYTDETVNDGTSYTYRLISRDYSGALNYYTEGTVKILVEMIPEGYTLQQNYPNPFNPETTIRYTLSQSATISLVVFDINGRKVRTLLNQKNTSEGVFQQKWDGRNDAGQFVASGTYLYRLFVHNNRKIMTKKMILIK
jgi:hypothetical protein